MRERTPLFVRECVFPLFRNPQQVLKEPALADQIKDKINNVRVRRYIAWGQGLILTYYSHVPKGGSDIRIVYYLTACELKSALWAPFFKMTTVHNVFDCDTRVLCFGDIDSGGMFLKYLLDISIRPFAVVYVSWIEGMEETKGEGGGIKWEIWTRMEMGVLSPPWVTTRLLSWAVEIIKGGLNSSENPCHWSQVILNCPGSVSYDPSVTRVYKLKQEMGCISED